MIDLWGADWETVERYLPKLWSPSINDLFEEEENGLIKEIRINLLNKEEKVLTGNSSVKVY